MTTLVERRPTKAEVEFEGDCFGRLYSKSAPECEICLVRKKCRKAMTGSGEEEKDVSVSSEDKKVINKEEQMPATKSKEKEKEVKVSKQFRNDKENGGLRPNSAGWAVYQVMKEACDKVFDVKELTKKSVVFCKEQKIKFSPDSKIPNMIGMLRKNGVIVKTGKGEFKRNI